MPLRETQPIQHDIPIRLQDQVWTSPADIPVTCIDFASGEQTQIFGNIRLLPLFSSISAPDLRTRVNEAGEIPPDIPIIALDFQVKGEGKKIYTNEGLLIGFDHPSNGIVNYDHHAPVPEMCRPVSTVPLVAAYLKSHAPIIRPEAGVIVVNHTDADSILSMLLLGGHLAPDETFSRAAVDADHTGIENPIADLLVALEEKRDLQYSIFCLNKYLRGETLPREAQELLDKRQQQRREVLKMVEDGLLLSAGNGVYFIENPPIGVKLRSEFFPAAKADAAAFVVPVPRAEGRFDYKVRAGNELPEGVLLNSIGLPEFGGRWNAGSTNRFTQEKGLTIPPREYAEIVRNAITKQMK